MSSCHSYITFRIFAQLVVIRFIRQAARWRRFFRCCLAASKFRSRSAD